MTKRNATVRAFKPVWPALSSLSAQRARFTYDRPTDTLFVDFYGESLPAASIPLDRGDRDYLFLRVDPDTDAVVGLQIEHFLSYAIQQRPEFVAALDFADLFGIDRETVRQIAHVDLAPTKTADASALLEEILGLSA